MAKIFSVDFRKGSYIDSVNKIVGVPTSLSKLIRTEKGTALARAVNHNGVTYTTGSKSLSKFTVVAWIKQITTDTKNRYSIAYIGNAQIIRRELSSIIYSNYFNSASLGAISIPITTSLNKWIQFVVTYDGTSVVSSVNNKQIVGSPSATTATLDFTSIIVGRGSDSTRYSDSDILKFDVYDDVIGDKELELDYKALLESQITEKPIRGFELVKPTDLSYQKDRGLLAAYNFKRNGNTLVDISGNGNNGTILSGNSSREGMVHSIGNGITVKDGALINTLNYTICGRIKLNDLMASDAVLFSNSNTTANTIIDSLGFKSGKLAWNYDGAGTFKNEITNPFVLGVWSDFVFISNGGRTGTIKVYIDGIEQTITTTSFYRSGNDVRIFNRANSDRPFIGECSDLRIYTRAFTEAEVKAYHNSWVNPVILEDWSGSAVGDTNPKEWQRISGGFEIKEDTEKKYLECTSNGIIAIPNDKAYGTWECSVNSQCFWFGFVKTDTSDAYTGGWSLGLYPDNKTVRLLRGGSSGSGFVTDVNYIQENVWYDYRITRTKDNTITCYIRGGSFGDNWTKITVSSGANPVTNTSYPLTYYLVLQASNNTKIGNIKFYDGVRQ